MSELSEKKFYEKYHERIEAKASILFETNYLKLCKDNDRMISALLIMQWFAAIIVAAVVSPKTWIGEQGLVNVHIYASVFLGGLLSLFPVYLNWKNPGAKVNRYANVIAQGMYSILFIHLTGGRIETHFHVFGSLAFFAFYRDLKLLAVGSLIVTIDHFVRGVWFPQSAFGVLGNSEWRWIEHAGWVIFEDMFLAYSCIRGLSEYKLVARKTAEVTLQHELAEEIVRERTQQIEEQQMQLVHSAKLSSLGEMAAGIAHEINNPLTVISASNKMLRRYSVNEPKFPDIEKYFDNIDKTVERINKIIKGMRNISRDESGEEFSKHRLLDIMNDVVSLCSERFIHHKIDLRINLEDPVYQQSVYCRPVQLSQVFINLLGNAFDAVEDNAEKWVQIDCFFNGSVIRFKFTDSGTGIPQEIKDKIFQPFFTTKLHGKGTGLGLSLSAAIIKEHAGVFKIEEKSKNTCFVIELPGDRRVAAA